MKYAVISVRTKLIITAVAVAILVVPVLLVFPLRGYRVDLSRPTTMPLAAELSVRTARPVRFTVTVAGLDGEDLQAGSSRYRRVQSIPVLGLYPDHQNRITVTLHYRSGRTRELEYTVATRPLPADFPQVRMETPLPDQVQPGMTFLNLGRYDDDLEYLSMPAAIDRWGRVRWYLPGGTRHLLRRLQDGTMLIQRDQTLLTVDLLGRPTGKEWTAPDGIHHDAMEIPGGNFLALSAAPGSYDDGVVELDRRRGTALRVWDFRRLLDEHRPRQPINLENEDWLHLNGIDWDPADESFIVSGRDQSAVVKVDFHTGEVRWILGAHDHWREPFRHLLLDPVGEPFEWSWGQHAPAVHPAPAAVTPAGPEYPLLRLLIYDNGNGRSYDNPLPPEESYSRAVEYEIDQEAGTVRQLWQYGTERGSELFTPFIGNAEYLTNGNRLVTFGGISRNPAGDPIYLFDLEAMELNRMKISAHIVEVTAETPARVVQELVLEDTDRQSYRGYRVYRSQRMSLYPPNLQIQ